MPTDMNPILDRLSAAFPACLNRSAPKPLKIGLGTELMALAGVHPALADLTRTQIRRALKIYTGSLAYQKALRKGGLRYDLEGQPAGEVTAEQQAFARTPRQKKAPTAPSSAGDPATPAAPALSPAERKALLEEVIAMAIPGKLDITLKINQLPQAKPASAQTMLFAVQADGRTVVVELKNKTWNSLKSAAESYPQWVAAITGKPGEAIEGGFRLDQPTVQVFEKKPKPEATVPAESKTPAPPPAPAEPALGSIERPKLSLKGRGNPSPG